MTHSNDELKRLANGMTRSEIGQAFDELIESYEQLQSKLDKACAALEFYRGDDDDDTSWMEPDQYVPYWTLWHDGSCVNGQKAKEALAEIRKKDDNG